MPLTIKWMPRTWQSVWRPVCSTSTIAMRTWATGLIAYHQDVVRPLVYLISVNFPKIRQHMTVYCISSKLIANCLWWVYRFQWQIKIKWFSLLNVLTFPFFFCQSFRCRLICWRNVTSTTWKKACQSRWKNLARSSNKTGGDTCMPAPRLCSRKVAKSKEKHALSWNLRVAVFARLVGSVQLSRVCSHCWNTSDSVDCISI